MRCSRSWPSGMTRIGATATKAIIDDFRARKAGGAARRDRGRRARGRLLMTAPAEVGIGMLGSGFIGEFHADGLRYVPDARVVAN